MLGIVLTADLSLPVETAATHYCGLEAKAVNPSNGNEALIYIVECVNVLSL